VQLIENNLAVTAILDFFQSANSLICPSHGDVGKPQKLWQFQNLDTQVAEIMKSFWSDTNLGELM